MPKTTAINIAAVLDARSSEDGAAGIVTVVTDDGQQVEIVCAPETGLLLGRATREAFSRAWIRQIELGRRPSTEPGPNDPMAAQAVEVVLDAMDPARVGIWALGTPLPPVIVMPTAQLPALIASAQQVIEDVGPAAGQTATEPGDQVQIPENTIRPAKIDTAVGETAILIIATDQQGVAQAMTLDLDRIDEYIEAIRSTQAEALRGRPVRKPN